MLRGRVSRVSSDRALSTMSWACLEGNGDLPMTSQPSAVSEREPQSRGDTRNSLDGQCPWIVDLCPGIFCLTEIGFEALAKDDCSCPLDDQVHKLRRDPEAPGSPSMLSALLVGIDDLVLGQGAKCRSGSTF